VFGDTDAAIDPGLRRAVTLGPSTAHRLDRFPDRVKISSRHREPVAVPGRASRSASARQESRSV